MTAQLKNLPVILDTDGGQFASISGHISSGDRKLKASGKISKVPQRDRTYRVGTYGGRRQIDHDREALNRVTAASAVGLIQAKYPQHQITDIGITAIAAALQAMDAKIKDRANGTSKGGHPLESEIVAVCQNDRPVLRLAKDQRSGLWRLQLCGVEQTGSKIVNMTTTERAQYDLEMAAESDRLSAGRYTRAVNQSAKWAAGDTDKLNSVIALLNAVIPKTTIQIRDLNLMGPGAVTCMGVALAGQRFTNPIDIVAAYRPDLLGLLK